MRSLPEAGQQEGGYPVNIGEAAQRSGVSAKMLRYYETLGLLGQDRGRSSANVKRIAQKHVDDLGVRIAAMQAMQRTLQDLLCHCLGDARPDCPILDDLAGQAMGKV